MARGDPNIPLSVQPRDFGARLLAVDAQNRANRLAETDIAGARQKQELIAAETSAPSESLIRSKTQAMVMDVMALPNLLDSGNQREAGRLGLHTRDNMAELGMDTGQIDRTLRLMAQDPAAASRFIKENVLPGLQPFLDNFSEDVLDTQGNIIGQRNMKTNEITAVDLGQEEAGLEFDNPSDQAMLRVRSTGGIVEPGRFETTPERLADINALSPEQATAQLTAGQVGRTEQDAAANITSTQRLAAGFAQRALDANTTITDLGSEFTGLVSRGVGAVPQGMRTANRQLFDQATENFVNAQLRRESGAAIAPSEFENANKQYIPQPGDGPEVLAQKTRNRQVVAETLKLEAGTALTQLSESLERRPALVFEGVEYFEGDTIENDSGQRARVNADGTLTEI